MLFVGNFHLAGEQFLGAAPDHVDGQEHQAQGHYQLEAFHHGEEHAGHGFLVDAIDGQAQGTHGHEEHEGHGHVEHPALPAGHLQEYCQGNQAQSTEQLVGSTKQLPDVHVTAQTQQVAGDQGHDGGHIGVAQEFGHRTLFLAFFRSQDFLEHHPADTGYRINGGHGQSGYAHGHDAGAVVFGNTEHGEVPADGAAEDGKRSGFGQLAVYSHGAGDNQGNHTQGGFNQHGAVANRQHVFFIGNGLGGSTGGNQGMEPGYSPAGDGDEQDGEQRLAGHIKGGEGRHIDGRIPHDNPYNSGQNHPKQQEYGQIVTRLDQQPHGHDGSSKAVRVGHIQPGGTGSVDGMGNAQAHHGHHAQNPQNQFLGTVDVETAGHYTEDHGYGNVDHGNGSGGGVGPHHFAGLGKAVEGAGHNVRESGDDQEGEQPAEHQEHFAAGMAHVFFNQGTHAFAVVLHGSIKGGEILYSPEEYAAYNNPQECRNPTEHGGDNGTGYRASTSNGRKLMGKYRETGSGSKVLVIPEAIGRSLRIRFNSPGLDQPASIKHVRTDEDYNGKTHKR